MPFRLLATLTAAVALGLAGCGSDSTSNAGKNGNGEKQASAVAKDGEQADNGADRAFVAEMIPHHESAVAMAEIAQKRGESRFVTQLADAIIRTQNAEITTMRQQDRELADAGVKRGSLGVPHDMQGMDDDPATLEDAEPFDREFLKMMIPHHEGAVTMAKAELAKGRDPELKQLANEIIAAQKREIREMRDELGADAAEVKDHSAH